jgi:transcriptional regulator with XRE-family HTH domain
MANLSAVKQELVLKSIGERLKKARESKGLSLEQARIKTRIHPRVLSALEDGRIDEVLSVTYARGFLKKYAEFLGLNTSEMLGEYLSLHREEKHETPISRAAPKKVLKLRSQTRSDLYLRGVIAVMVMTALFSLVVYFKAHGPKAGPQTGAIERTVPLAGRGAKDSFFVAAKKARKTPPSVPQKGESALLQVYREGDKFFIPAAIPKNEPITLTVKTKRNVLVEISKDGYTLFGYVLRGGIVETVRAQEKIVLSVANISAVELTLNGRHLSIPRKGEVKNIEITRSGVRLK